MTPRSMILTFVLKIAYLDFVAAGGIVFHKQMYFSLCKSFSNYKTFSCEIKSVRSMLKRLLTGNLMSTWPLALGWSEWCEHKQLLLQRYRDDSSHDQNGMNITVIITTIWTRQSYSERYEHDSHDHNDMNTTVMITTVWTWQLWPQRYEHDSRDHNDMNTTHMITTAWTWQSWSQWYEHDSDDHSGMNMTVMIRTVWTWQSWYQRYEHNSHDNGMNMKVISTTVWTWHTW